MKKICCSQLCLALTLLSVCALPLWCSEMKSAKLVEIRDASFTGAGIAADASLGVATAPSAVPAYVQKCVITVSLDGTLYSAIYPVDKHFKITDVVEGEDIPARIEGNRLVLQRPDGKEMKSKIVRKEQTPKP